MVKLKIDNRVVEAEKGAVLIDVIRRSGIEVPSMCYLEGEAHFTSCMVCVVKDGRSGKIVPSCSLVAEDGMDILCTDPEVAEARKIALELLLSEHIGDCEAPCQVTCPAHMEIPLMNRLLARGDFAGALKIVKRDIALPSVFGRICPAPCEGACHRKTVDEPVSICLLKRFAGDHDLGIADHSATAQDQVTEHSGPWMPPMEPSTGKKVGIIGAGPAGLASAWHLALKGHHCTVVDRNSEAGGSMLKETTQEELPREVLASELALFRLAGVEFRLGEEVDANRFRTLTGECDAVIVATGKDKSVTGGKVTGGTGGDAGKQHGGIGGWGLPMNEKGVEADPDTYRVGETHIFVTGSALKPSRLAIRALGQGKESSFSVDQFLRGEPVTGEKFMFNSRFGKLMPEEFAEYLKESVKGSRIEPAVPAAGFTAQQVISEAARCMHCDCRDLQVCRLRIYSDFYGADQKRFKPAERAPCKKIDQHDLVIYEPGKCIKCGICVRIAEKYQEGLGLTFIGRGFEMVVGVPFNETLASGLRNAAEEVAEKCPTGAITKK